MDLQILRQLKKQKKMTNQQLSIASGVPLGTVNKLMSGVTDNPKLPTVQAIAKALGTTVDGITNDTMPEGVNQGHISVREEQLLYICRKLDNRGFETVMAAARLQLEFSKKSDQPTAGAETESADETAVLKEKKGGKKDKNKKGKKKKG